MWKIFDNITEKTLVFYNDNLIYANISALQFLNSYMVSLTDKTIKDLFTKDSADVVLQNSEENIEFDAVLSFKKVKGINFKVKIYHENGEKYIIIQEKSSNKKQAETEFARIIAPKSIYDPLRIGKASIINYELTDPYMKISEILKNAINTSEDTTKLKEASVLLDRLFEKTKMSINELADFDEKYGLVKSEFGVSDLVSKIATRMNSYFLMENINAEIEFTRLKKHDAVVCADYLKVANSIITLISLLIDILSKKRKKAQVKLEVIKEDGYCFIKIIASDVQITKKVYDELIKKNKEIINLSRYNENKITMNIHIASSYIELNGGELFVKRDKTDGTIMSIKLPTIKTRYFLGENNIISDEEIDKIISNRMFGI